MNTVSAKLAMGPRGLWLLGLSLLLIGAAYAVFPAALLAITGQFSLDSQALLDARVTYGGLQMALGAYVLSEWRAANHASLWRLLAWVLFVVGGLRLAFSLLAAPVDALHALVAIAELLLAALCAASNFKAARQD